MDQKESKPLFGRKTHDAEIHSEQELDVMA